MILVSYHIILSYVKINMIFFTYLFKKSCSHENFSKIKTHIYSFNMSFILTPLLAYLFIAYLTSPNKSSTIIFLFFMPHLEHFHSAAGGFKG